MASTSDFRNGLIFKHKNGLWKIVEFLHVKPGKGPAFVRTKLKNIKSGQVVEETFRSGGKIDIVRVESKDYVFLYKSDNSYFFMDNKTYDQIELSVEQIEPIKDFLIDSTQTTILFNSNDPIEVRIPQHINYKIIKTDPGEKGNTAQGGTKPAIIETGITIQVPLFIKEGETIKVDTKERKYVERVKL